jgi:hypothetical protein
MTTVLSDVSFWGKADIKLTKAMAGAHEGEPHRSTV